MLAEHLGPFAERSPENRRRSPCLILLAEHSSVRRAKRFARRASTLVRRARPCRATVLSSVRRASLLLAELGLDELRFSLRFGYDSWALSLGFLELIGLGCYAIV